MSNKFQAERGAYDRTGISWTFYSGEKDKARQLKTAEDLFLIGLDITTHKYFDENSFTPNEREDIKSLVSEMKFPQFKNPEAFLLAYSILDLKSKEFGIDKKEFKKIKEKIESKDDKKISDTDLLRYARMIYNLKKK